MDRARNSGLSDVRVFWSLVALERNRIAPEGQSVNSMCKSIELNFICNAVIWACIWSGFTPKVGVSCFFCR